MSKIEEIKVHLYPFDKNYVFSLTLDDLHPESSKDLEHLDFGSSIFNPPLIYLKKLITEIPEIKITLFTVPNWIDRSDLPNGLLFPLRKIWRRRRAYTTDSFNVTDSKYDKWVLEINTFYPQNIEIAPHGLLHYNSNLKHFRSEEFAGLTRNEISKRLDEAENIFRESGLRYSKAFRPPGWFITEDLLQVLREMDYHYVAANSDMDSTVKIDGIARGAGLKNQYLLKETYNDGIYNFTANCYPDQIDRAVGIARLHGILMVHCHIAGTEFGLKALDKSSHEKIKSLLQEIKYRTGFKPWFATLEELASFTIARDSINYRKSSEGAVIKNNSKYDIHGLTVEISGRNYIIDVIKAGRAVEVKEKEITSDIVSIVLTVYNGEKTILESLKSLVNQSYDNIEIIIVNDGSTDKTQKIVEEYLKSIKGKIIHVINQNNGGRANAKNAGLKNASGKYITFCEDDAIYSSDYIKYAVDKLKDKKVLGVIGPHFVWNRDDSITTRAKDLERRRNFYNYKPTSAWIYRTNDLEKIGGFNESLEFGEDVEPGIKLKNIYPDKDFAYSEESIWLHREPQQFERYLERKFRGGIGMALLDRMKIRKFPGKLKILFVLLPLLIIGIVFLLVDAFIFIHPWYLVLLGFVLLSILVLLYVRRRDIKKSITLSSENIFAVSSFILLEYVWWAATLFGIYVGFMLPMRLTRQFLRGR